MTLQRSPEGGATRRVMRVGELTMLIRGTLATQPALEDCLVEGEIANLRAPGSGHLYFTLRDAGSSLRCVCFRSDAQRIGFAAADGMRVVAHGRVDVYAQDGTYQLYVDRLDPSGLGALALATEQVRRRLAAEGLFDERHKRPLPLLPRRIAVVTSPTGAAVRDVLNVVRRRAPGVGVVVVPAPVQGDGAELAIVEALRRAERVARCDVVLLVRGGGSLEDLRTFQDERVARAVRACALPVVTGIGHQTDTTIADLAADRAGATPSVAAQIAVPDVAELRRALVALRRRLDGAVGAAMSQRRVRLAERTARLDRVSPSRRLPELRQRLDAARDLLRHGALRSVALKRRELDAATARLQRGAPNQRVLRERGRLIELEGRLHGAARGAATARRSRLERDLATLHALSPLRILERGYSVTRDAAGGALVTSAAQAPPGTRLVTRLHDGSVESDVR